MKHAYIKAIIVDWLLFFMVWFGSSSLITKTDWEVDTKMIVFGGIMYLYGAIIEDIIRDIKRKLRP